MALEPLPVTADPSRSIDSVRIRLSFVVFEIGVVQVAPVELFLEPEVMAGLVELAGAKGHVGKIEEGVGKIAVPVGALWQPFESLARNSLPAGPFPLIECCCQLLEALGEFQ